LGGRSDFKDGQKVNPSTVTIPAYIKGNPSCDWGLEYFFENDRDVSFSQVPKTADLEVHSEISRYITTVRRHNLSPYYVSLCRSTSIYCSNDCGSVTVFVDEETVLNDVSSRYLHPNKPINPTESPEINGLSCLLTFDSACNYFHWLCHILPRLHLLNQYETNLSKIKRFILPNNLTSFMKETLAHLDIPKEKFFRAEPNNIYKFNELIIPSLPNKHIHLCHWSLNFLRSSFLSGETKSEKKLYICRRKDEGRHVDNEAEVWNLLSSMNYERVYPEELSVLDQAKLFSSAKVIISPHGAALANLIFCNKECRVIELFNSIYFSALYWNICNIMKLDYSYIVGDSTQTSNKNAAGQREKNYNFLVNTDILLRLLK
jgi:hypothetical protein